jgi:hypothetical protein
MARWDLFHVKQIGAIRSAIYRKQPPTSPWIDRELRTNSNISRVRSKSGSIPKDRVTLAEHRIPLIADAYFLLNRAYKDWRISDGHFTERPKIAALQAIVIARLQPFFPSEYPVDEADIGIVKCNEIYAFSYGMGILEKSFTADTPEKAYAADSGRINIS